MQFDIYSNYLRKDLLIKLVLKLDEAQATARQDRTLHSQQ